MPKFSWLPIFNNKMPMESGLGALYKRKYCQENHDTCARFKVSKALGKEKVQPIYILISMVSPKSCWPEICKKLCMCQTPPICAFATYTQQYIMRIQPLV
jgi:hypothetical protein